MEKEPSGGLWETAAEAGEVKAVVGGGQHRGQGERRRGGLLEGRGAGIYGAVWLEPTGNAWAKGQRGALCSVSNPTRTGPGPVEPAAL